MLRSVLIGLTGVFAFASLYGCATPASPGGEAKEARDQPVYRTGSNLPVKDPSQKSEVGSMSGEAYNNQMQPGLHPQLPGGAGRSP